MLAGFALTSSLVALLSSWPGASASDVAQRAEPARYHLTFNRVDMRTVTVRASFTLQDTLLFMLTGGMTHLPDGWRTFVRNEQLRDANGKLLPIRRIDQRRWVVDATPGTRVELSYVVRIDHDQPPTNWFPGPREAAYARDWGVFALGRALFVLPGAEFANTLVEFSVPQSWRVAAALPSEAGTTNTFRAPTRRDMTDALYFVGDFVDLTLRQGPLTFEFALGPPFKEARSLFERVTRNALTSFRNVFGVDPIKDKYLVVVNPEYLQTDGFGGAFRSGFSMTFPFVPGEQNIGIWAFTLTHETFHLWNAFTIARASDDEEWFLEGSADYYTLMTLARSGVYSQEMALQRMALAFSAYQRAAGGMSLAAAGANEASGGTLLYQGGWSILTALDLDIRRRTNDEKSFDDVWRLLVARLSPTSQPYRNDDILRAVNTVSGADYTDFFANYVTGTKKLDLAPFVSAAGLALRNGNLSVRADAPAVERARLQHWIGRQ